MKAKKRNRSAEAFANGKRISIFHITENRNNLLEQVRKGMALTVGGKWTRARALEALIDAGAKILARRHRFGIDQIDASAKIPS